MPDFIPRSENDFYRFQYNLLVNLARYLPGSAKPLGFTQSDYNLLKGVADKYSKLYHETNKSNMRYSRTGMQVKARQEQRKLLTKHIRRFLNKWVHKNELISSADLVGLSLRIPDDVLTPAPQTHDSPRIYAEPMPNRMIKIHFRSDNVPGFKTRIAKPKGISRAEFCYIIGNKPPEQPSDCNLFFSTGRSSYIISFDHVDSGKRFYFFARWVNTRNQPGRWAGPHSAVIT